MVTKPLPVRLMAAREEGKVKFLCTMPHPKRKGEICNAVLAIVPIGKVEDFTGVLLNCHQCRESTRFD